MTELRGRGLHDTAFIIEGTPFKNFAKWRWGTLYICCKSILAIKDLCYEFCGDAFSGCQDSEMVADVIFVFSGCPTFWTPLKYVFFLMRDTNYIRMWGAGCACHEEQLKRGEKVASTFINFTCMCVSACMWNLVVCIAFIYIGISQLSQSQVWGRKLQIN